MGACKFTALDPEIVKQLKDTLTNYVDEVWDNESLSLASFKQEIRDRLYNQFLDSDNSNTTVESLVNSILNLIRTDKVLSNATFESEEVDDFWVSDDTLSWEFLKTSDTDTTEDTISGTKEADLDDVVKEPKRTFISDAFRSSISSEKLMLDTFSGGMYRVFIDSKSIDALNSNMDAFKERLFNKIVQYLINVHPENQTELSKLKLFDEDGNYNEEVFKNLVHDYEKDFKYLNPHLSIKGNRRMTVEDLDRFALNYYGDNKLTLDAYIANFILSNFDNMIKKYYPKFEIRPGTFGVNNYDKTRGHKYTFSSMSHAEQNFRDDSKEIVAADLMDDITRTMVEQMRVSSFGSTGTPTDEKLTLGTWNRLITKLKSFAFTPAAFTSFSALGFDDLRAAVVEVYSEDYTRTHDNLFSIIGELNDKAITNYRKFFELLAKPAFWNNANIRADLRLNNRDQDYIWSIYRNVFRKRSDRISDLQRVWDANNEDLSMYERFMLDPDPSSKYNYFNYLVQACVSVEALQLQQYKFDGDGIVNQTLQDSVNAGSRGALERQITSQLSPVLSATEGHAISDRFAIQYSDKYRDKELDDDSDYNRYLFKELPTTIYRVDGKLVSKQLYDKSDSKSKIQTTELRPIFTFVVNPESPKEAQFKVRIDPKSSTLKLTITKNGETYGKGGKLFTEEDLKAIIPFINNLVPAIKINSINSPVLVAFKGIVGNNSIDSVTNQLLRLASTVFMNASVVHEIRSRRNQLSEVGFNSELLKYYGANNKPALNTHVAGGGIRTLVGNNLISILDHLNMAINAVEGVYGDNMTKDSQGKMLNQIGISMLATKVDQLVATLNLQETSASKHFTLWNSSMYRGCQFTREWAGNGESLGITKFNVNEHLASLLIYDFVGGYVQRDRGLKYVSIMPSILSDKSRILKILIDMDAECPYFIYDIPEDAEDYTIHYKKYKDLTAEEWKQASSIELGSYYLNIWNQTVDVFGKLNAWQQTHPMKLPMFNDLGEVMLDANNNILTTDAIVNIDIRNNFQDLNAYIKQWEKANDSLKKVNKNVSKKINVKKRPVDIFHDLLVEYNKENPPISIIDLMHYVSMKDGTISANRLVVSELYRFSDAQGNIEVSATRLNRNTLEIKDFENWVSTNYTTTRLERDPRTRAIITNTVPIKIGYETGLVELNNLGSIKVGETTYNPLEFLKMALAAYTEATGKSINYGKYFVDDSNNATVHVSNNATVHVSNNATVHVSNNSRYVEKLRGEGNTILGTYWDNQGFQTNEQFWARNESELLHDIIENGFEINTTTQAGTTINSPEFNRLASGDLNNPKGNAWLDTDTRKIILGKFTFNDNGKTRTIKITDQSTALQLKYKKGDETITFNSPEFKMSELIAAYPDSKLELNPCIATWNAANFMISLEYMNSTVGTHLNHPSKKYARKGSKISDLEEEAERWLAQVKRNVSISASKHSFALGLLNGIRNNYRIAVVEDDEVVTYNVQGQYSPDGAKPFDGATIVCGTNNYMENNSLAGASAGVDKKQFVHSYDPATGSGIIIKTAGFAITNARIRQSPFYARANRKMMLGIWKTKNGLPFIPDLRYNFYGLALFGDVKSPSKFENMFFFDEITGNYYQIVGLDKVYEADGTFKGRWERRLKQVNADGTDVDGRVLRDLSTETVAQLKKKGLSDSQISALSIPKHLQMSYEPINSNYKLWQLFGGANTVELKKDGGTAKFIDSESSFRNLVVAINSISEDGLPDTDNKFFTTKIGADGKPSYIRTGSIAESQNDVYQNLKFSNIDYIVTAGAIKQGAANVNSKKAYFNDDYELATMEISMHDAGILLDAEHHADESTLSIMTLVVNALCARGYTLDSANEAYMALKALTEYGISDCLQGLHEFLDVPNGSKETLQEAIADTIVKGLKGMDDREGSLVEAVAETILEAAKDGTRIKYKDLVGVIPFGHPAMFKKLTSIISTAFNKQGIKIKFPGVLAVLNPSNKIYKIYANKMLRDFARDKSGTTTQEALLAEQAKQIPLNSFAEINLGHHYIVDGLTEEDLNQLEILGFSNTIDKTNITDDGKFTLYIEDPKDQWAMEDFLADNSNRQFTFTENVTLGRDLATYQIHFQGTNANGEVKSYNLWNVDSVKNLFRFNDLAGILEDFTDGDGNFDISKYKGDKLLMLLNNTPLEKGGAKEKLDKWINRNWSTLWKNKLYDEEGRYSFDKFLATLNEWVSVNTGEEVPEALTNISLIKTLRNLLKRELQRSLNALGTGKAETTTVNGETVTVDKNSVKTNPYELIMPKIYAKRFGLTEGDSLNDVMSQGSQFFVRRFAEKWASKIVDDKFDIELKRTSGEHTYIIQKSELNNEAYLKSLGLTKLEDPEKQWEGKELWRTDKSGDKNLYRLSDDSDEIWIDEETGTEIILTDNVNYFVNHSDYDDIRFSDSVISSNLFANYSNLVSLSSNKIAKKYISRINNIPAEALTELVNDPEYTAGNRAELWAKHLNKWHRAGISIEALNTALSNGETVPYALKRIVDTAEELFTSFKESLKVLAARIPSQSMLSFMAMKVVGFDDSNINSAYVNYWQIYLQGSDFDIDKVSLLGLLFSRSGKFAAWSNLFNISSDEYLAASKEIPFPTNKTINSLGVTDEKLLDLYNRIINANIYNNSNKVSDDLTPDQIKELAALIRELNLQEDPNNATKTLLYKPTGNLSKVDETKLESFIKTVNTHNAYLQNARDSKGAIINFISSYMYKVSDNPINLILSQSSVDDMTQMVKDIANNAPSATRTARYAPGNAESKMETLILTLTGKDNTGIVASAMKTYEALSFYFNHRVQTIVDKYNSGLATGESTNRSIAQLMFNQGKGLTVCGQTVKLLSNTFTDRDLSEIGIHAPAFKLALDSIDNDSDAFLLVSALLSLATDNAKDPTLSKINAGPDMIGLYTAGIALGIDFGSLTSTMMSKTGNIINSLLNGNVFDRLDNRKLSDVLTYIDEGPSLSHLNTTARKVLTNAIINYRALRRKTQEEIREEEEKKRASLTPEERAAKEKELDIAFKQAQSELNLQIKEETAVLSGKKIYSAEDLRSALLDILRTDGPKAVSRILLGAKLATNATYNAVQDVTAVIEYLESLGIEEIDPEDAKFKEVLDNLKTAKLLKEAKSKEELTAILKEAKAALEEESKDTEEKKAKRQLAKLVGEWSNYAYKWITIQSEFIAEDRSKVNAWRPNKLENRTSPEQCYKEGHSYIYQDPADGKLKARTLITYIAPPEEEVKQYEADSIAWRKEYREWYKTNVSDVRLANTKKYNEEMEKWRVAYNTWKNSNQQGEAPKKPRRATDPLKLKDVKKAHQELLDRKPKRPVAEGNVFSEPVVVFNPYESIKKLSEINTEMGRLRNILSLNQGLPNSMGDQMADVHTFSNIILDRLSEFERNGGTPKRFKSVREFRQALSLVLGNDGKLDIHKFITNPIIESQGKGYRDLAIEFYEDIKCAYNVLDAAWEVPHYRGYLEALDGLYHTERQVALAYRTSYDLGTKVVEAFGYKGSDKISQAYESTVKFVLNKVNNIFLKTTGKSFTIDVGLLYYDSNNNLKTATSKMTIKLGTDHGNATFKLWFEGTVIPNIKRNFFGEYLLTNGLIDYTKENTRLAINKFIRDLVPTEIDKTLTGNAVANYSLPISMIARSDSEEARYREYKTDFGKLKALSYVQQVIDPNTGEIIQQGTPLRELFYLYNLIAYGNESNTNAFSEMFEDSIKDGSLIILNQYIQFLSEFDPSYDFQEGVDYTLQELLQWCAPLVVDLSQAKTSYVRFYNPLTMEILLLQKMSREEIDYYYDQISKAPTPEESPQNFIQDNGYRLASANSLNFLHFSRSVFDVPSGVAASGKYEGKKIAKVNSKTFALLGENSNGTYSLEIVNSSINNTPVNYTIDKLLTLYDANIKDKLAKAGISLNDANMSRYEARRPKASDFDMIYEVTTNSNGEPVREINTRYLDALLQEIFDPCL